MHDPDAAEIAIFGARGDDAHSQAVPLNFLAGLEFVVEPLG